MFCYLDCGAGHTTAYTCLNLSNLYFLSTLFCDEHALPYSLIIFEMYIILTPDLIFEKLFSTHQLIPISSLVPEWELHKQK